MNEIEIIALMAALLRDPLSSPETVAQQACDLFDAVRKVRHAYYRCLNAQ
jgi:hypothetical protein